jgi:hypothetical protein
MLEARDVCYYDDAEYFEELYFEAETPLCVEGIASIPSRHRSSISHVIGPGGATIRLLQRKHECRIKYIKRHGGFVISGGSRRKVEAARRDILQFAEAANRVAEVPLLFDARLIRGDRGERMAMVERSFDVSIRFRPIMPVSCDPVTAATQVKMCLQCPLLVAATVVGGSGAIERVVRYFEKLDAALQRR